jgi:hypothetical protein
MKSVLLLKVDDVKLTAKQEAQAKVLADELVEADRQEHPGGNAPDPAWVLEGARLGYLWGDLLDKEL